MRILVCGGRDFDDYNLLSRTLHEVIQSTVKSPDENMYENTVIIHGWAKGADTMADRWAFTNNIKVKRHAANWNKYGKAAGPIRNGVMLKTEKPDLVVAFPGDIGTADMVTQAKAARVEVREIE